MKEFLPYSRQQIDDADISAVVEVLKSDFLTTGPKVDAFETAFASKVGAKHAVVCSSGTAGLHMATTALGLSQNDVAILPAITFLSTANAVRFTGAEVVFADVDQETGLITEKTAETALSNVGSAKVMLPVHLNGQCCDMEDLTHWAEKNKIAVVEDACHALGGYYNNGKKIGSGERRLTVFSSHPVKAIAMGEGGVVTTEDRGVAERLRRLRNHGMVRDSANFASPEQGFAEDGTPNPWYYEMQTLGFNYRTSDIHCALGLSQLNKLDGFVTKQNRLVDLYAERLKALSPVVKPVGRRCHGTPAWHVAVVLIDFAAAGVDRAAVMNGLREHGIGSQVLYMPLYRQPYYERRYGKQQLPGAETYYERALCLPLFSGMIEDDIDRVVEALEIVLGMKTA